MSAFKYTRLDKTQAAILLVDHQAGLISLVQDFPPNEFKNNVLALAALAKFFKLPTILTTSFEEGPNGPIVPELKQMFPDAPYIARPGNINAWTAGHRKGVKATGKKQLIIAGFVPTSVWLSPRSPRWKKAMKSSSSRMPPAHSTRRWPRPRGRDFSGGRTALRLRRRELHRDWRNDIEGLGNLLSTYIPNYRNLMTSFMAKASAKKQ